MGQKENVELLMAVSEGNLDKVDNLIKARADVNYVSEKPEADDISEEYTGLMTPLLLAAKRGHTQIVKILIENKADLMSIDGDSNNALMLAMESKNIETIELLLQQKTIIDNINTENRYQATALHYAVYKSSSPEIIKKLLEVGANPLLQSALYLARQYHQQDSYGIPLNSSVFQNNPELIEQYFNNKELEKHLKSNMDDGQVLLIAAIRSFNMTLIKRLDKSGILKQIVSYINTDELNQITTLLKETLLQDSKKNKKKALIILGYFAPKLSNFEQKKLVQYFKKNNIDLMYAAAEFGRSEIANFLHLMGESLGGSYTGQNLTSNNSLLHVATQNNQSEMVDYLIKQGLDVNARNSLLETPLILAAENSSTALVKYLVEQGAKTAIPNSFGYTPMMAAQYLGLNDVVELINEKSKKTDKKLNSKNGNAIKAGIELDKTSNTTDPTNKGAKNTTNILAQSSDDIYNDFVQNMLFIKQAGHALGMRSNIILESDIAGKKVEISTENSLTLTSNEQLLGFISDYAKSSSLATDAKKYFDKIKTAFEITVNFLKFNGTVTVQDLQRRYQSGELTAIPSGWTNHDVCEVFYKNYLVDSDRGGETSSLGTVIRNIPDQSLVTADLFRALNPPGKRVARSKIRDAFGKVVNLNEPPFENLRTKEQKWGTCSFVNPKAALRGILYLLKFEELIKEANLIGGSRGMDFDKPDEKLTSELRKTAMEFAKREYKKFTYFIRNQEIDILIKSCMDPISSSQKKKIAFDLLLEYVITHHGQQKKNSSHSRNIKTKNEVFRLEYIFKVLDEENRNRLLEELGKRRILIYEIATSSTDFKNLLENKWKLKLKDVLSQKDHNGFTPLMRAIILSKEPKTIYEMLELPDADKWLNLKNNGGKSAIHIAIYKNDVELVKRLAAHPDIDLNVRDDHGNTAFSVAASKSNSEIMLIISNAERQKEARLTESFRPRI